MFITGTLLSLSDVVRVLAGLRGSDLRFNNKAWEWGPQATPNPKLTLTSNCRSSCTNLPCTDHVTCRSKKQFFAYNFAGLHFYPCLTLRPIFTLENVWGGNSRAARFRAGLPLCSGPDNVWQFLPYVMWGDLESASKYTSDPILKMRK